MSDEKPQRLPPRWWRQFPKTESRTPRPQPPEATPELQVGDYVRLRGKPERRRMVLSAEWHRHRYEFVYCVETSTMSFVPYWFLAQLMRCP